MIAHHDQVVSIPEMQAWVNVREAIHVLEHICGFNGKNDYLNRRRKSFLTNTRGVHDNNPRGCRARESTTRHHKCCLQETHRQHHLK